MLQGLTKCAGAVNIQELKSFEFFCLKRYGWCLFNFLIPTSQHCVCIKGVIAAALGRHDMNQTYVRIISVSVIKEVYRRL